jgi:flagellar hook-basal body complex protein FliE
MTNDELEKAIEKAEKAAEKAAKEAAAADKGKIKAKVNVTLYRSNTSHVHFKAGQVITDAEFAAQCKKDGLAE